MTDTTRENDISVSMPADEWRGLFADCEMVSDALDTLQLYIDDDNSVGVFALIHVSDVYDRLAPAMRHLERNLSINAESPQGGAA
jgi:hypothetical protein